MKSTFSLFNILDIFFSCWQVLTYQFAIIDIFSSNAAVKNYKLNLLGRQVSNYFKKSWCSEKKGPLMSEWLLVFSIFSRTLAKNLWFFDLELIKLIESDNLRPFFMLLDSRAEIHQIFALVIWKIEDTKKSFWD